jgi:hypothetical protein
MSKVGLRTLQSRLSFRRGGTALSAKKSAGPQCSLLFYAGPGENGLMLRALDFGASAVFAALCIRAYCVHLCTDIERQFWNFFFDAIEKAALRLTRRTTKSSSKERARQNCIRRVRPSERTDTPKCRVAERGNPRRGDYRCY